MSMGSYTDCVWIYGELYRLGPSYVIYVSMLLYIELPRAAHIRKTGHILKQLKFVLIHFKAK